MAAITIWASPTLARNLPLTSGFEPVRVWDNEKRAFTDEQQKKNDLPVWQAEALLPTGWGAQLTPVAVRMASASKPAITVDPARVLEAMGMTQPQAHRGGEG